MAELSFVAASKETKKHSLFVIGAVIVGLTLLAVGGALFYSYSKKQPERAYAAFDQAIAKQDYVTALAVYRDVSEKNAKSSKEAESPYYAVSVQIEADVSRKISSMIKQLDVGVRPSAADKQYVLGLGELTAGRIATQMRERGAMYLSGEIEEAHWLLFVDEFGNLANIKGAIGDLIGEQTDLVKLRPQVIDANALTKAGQFVAAKTAWQKITNQKMPPFAANIILAKQKENLDTYYKTTMAQIEGMIKYRRFLSARTILSNLQDNYGNDDKIKQMLLLCQEQLPTELEPYNGHIRHLALRPLIVNETLASATTTPIEIKRDHITSTQFIKLLNTLYKQGYVLVRGDSFIGPNGRTSVYVPTGKKPLVLNFMEIEYTKPNEIVGLAGPLQLNDRDEYTNETMANVGGETSKTNQSAVPLLEDFLKKHPDFSIDGARATLSLTGRYGVLGQVVSERQTKNVVALSEKNNLISGAGKVDFSTAQKEATRLASSLQQRGYIFASSTYDVINLTTASDGEIADNIAAWKQDVTPLIGEVAMLFCPRGYFPAYGSARSTQLIKEKYSVFTGYGSRPYIQQSGSAFHVDLTPVTGYTLINPDDYKLNDAFDVASVR